MPRPLLIVIALVAATLATAIYMSTAESSGWGHVLLAAITGPNGPSAV